MKAGLAIALSLLCVATVPAQQKESVDGIGGFFFKAKSPKALAQWYSDHLGVAITPPARDELPGV